MSNTLMITADMMHSPSGFDLNTYIQKHWISGLIINKPEFSIGADMTADSFCFWLQGFFDISDTNKLSTKQVEIIRAKLNKLYNNCETLDLSDQQPGEDNSAPDVDVGF